MLKNILHEISVGFALFFSIFYIFILIPHIYAQAGLSLENGLVIVALVVAISSLFVGLYNKLPIVIAPGVTIATYAVFTLSMEKGLSWDVITAAIFLEGLIFLALSISRLRQWFAIGIPNSFKYGILAGIGLFLAFFGLKASFIFDSSTYPSVSFLNINTVVSFVAVIFGFVLISKRIPGAFFLTILFVFALSVISGFTHITPIYFSVPSFSLPSFNFEGLSGVGMLSIVLSLFMVDFFDGLGASTSLLMRMGKLDKKGHIKGLDKLMVSDSLTTIFSSLLGGTASVIMLESGLAIEEKTKTIIPNLVVFLLSLTIMFFSPVLNMFSLYTASPVLIILGMLFFSSIKMENFKNLDDLFPALITTITIPATMSISSGIGLGSISYVLVKLLLGKYKDLNLSMIIIALLFFMDYIHLF